ncbi:MAG: helicase-associated domain-containing protein [Treponema sp.]|nr:helicase-associated domain-containing protein [Treponema sp.]
MEIEKENPKVQRIIRWRNTLSLLDDERFFEIMRIYIGEIHTPFNKDKLIEQLSSIFRKEQNKEKIIAYLSEFDIKIISAISSIKNASRDKITDFFKSEYPVSEIYSQLLNLNERLIIYSYKNDKEESLFAINPLLEELLQPYINLKKLISEPVFLAHNFDPPFTLTPLFIASFISYIYENPEMCRNNCEFKKKDIEKLNLIFPGKIEILKKLFKGLVNLKLIKIGEKSIEVDQKRFEIFSENPEVLQYAFLSTAAAVRLGREGLRSQTQLLLDVAASTPQTGVSKSSLLRIAFLISNKVADEDRRPGRSRFSRMIESHLNSSDKTEYSGQIEEEIIDNAITFGLFTEIGKSETEEAILIPGPVLTNQELKLSSEQKKGILNINAGTNITIMPGLTLNELMQLVLFMDVKSSSTVTEFEINRKSISRAFDKNLTKEDILERLSLYNAYKIPQNLEINIEEWQTSYSSALLYKGYILKVDEKIERLVQNNPKIAPYIQLKLATGIFLLNIPLSQDADLFIKESGLEFMGNVKAAAPENETINYPPVNQGANYFYNSIDNPQAEQELLASSQKADEFKKALIAKLESMELSKQQYEGLLTRIERKVILNEEQLKPETVRLEILEADGMNYNGKIHLLENAIQAGDMIELTIPNEKDSSIMETFLGQPLMLAKQTNDSLVKFADQKSGEIRFYSVSRANHIKIIRTSIFR